MNTNAMLAIFAIATLALIVPLTMNIQPAYSQATRCRDSSFEGGSTHRCITPGSEPSGTETICKDIVGCVTFEDADEPPSSNGQLGRLYEFCSESQSPRLLPGRTAECSVQPDDNAR
jgi:hypothetical protein